MYGSTDGGRNTTSGVRCGDGTSASTAPPQQMLKTPLTWQMAYGRWLKAAR
jgi:hypothetical protein